MSSNRFALIIANDQYEDESLSELEAPKFDAYALAEVLGDPGTCNFYVQLAVNKNSYTVNQLIEAFFNKRKRDDLLLLYFSGHGVKDEDGKLYFATPNTRRDRLISTGISASIVNELMRKTRSRSQILLLDCCYSGAFAKGMIAKSGSAIGSTVGTNDYFQGRGRIVLTASDSMQYAFEEDKLVEKGSVNSIFTSAIVEGIKTWEADSNGDNRISIHELYDFVDGYVQERTPNQQPVMWSFNTQGEMIIAERKYAPMVEGEEVEVYEHVPQYPEDTQPPVEIEPPVEVEPLPVELEPSSQVQISAELVKPFLEEPEATIEIPIKPLILVVIILVAVIGLAYWRGIGPFNPTTDYVDDDGGVVPTEGENTTPSEGVSANRTANLTNTESYVLVTSWGGSEGSGIAQFSGPWGIATDSSGNVYVADEYNHRVLKFTQYGEFITTWGSHGSGFGDFFSPAGITVDQNDTIYVVDRRNDRVQKFTSSGTYINSWGSEGSGDGQLDNPFGIAIDSSGDVYISDNFNNRIQKFTSDGVFILNWDTRTAPVDVCVDSENNVYITDFSNHRIKKYTSEGVFITYWGNEGSEDGQFQSPFGVAIDSSGNVYVADSHARIQKFTSDGVFLANWGSLSSEDAELWESTGLTFSLSDVLYVTDTHNQKVLCFEQTQVNEDEHSTSIISSTPSWQGSITSGWSAKNPIIDGFITDEEWDDASQYNITLNYLVGAVTSVDQYKKEATIFVKNDADNLFIALKIYDAPYATTIIYYCFDQNYNGIIDLIEDEIFTGFWKSEQRIEDGVIFNEIEKQEALDRDVGGSPDVLGRYRHTNPQDDEKGTLCLEIKRPLDTGDRYDISVKPGDQIGYGIEYVDYSENEFNGATLGWPKDFGVLNDWYNMAALLLAENPS